MAHDVENGPIANATIEPDEHGEIEITPEMIEAARDVFWGADWNDSRTDSRCLAEEVIRAAMVAGGFSVKSY